MDLLCTTQLNDDPEAAYVPLILRSPSTSLAFSVLDHSKQIPVAMCLKHMFFMGLHRRLQHCEGTGEKYHSPCLSSKSVQEYILVHNNTGAWVGPWNISWIRWDLSSKRWLLRRENVGIHNGGSSLMLKQGVIIWIITIWLEDEMGAGLLYGHIRVLNMR